MRLADDFRPFLDGLDPAELERSTSVTCGLRPDLTLALRNGAWARFAASNAGPDPGAWDDRPVLEAISGPLRIFHADLLRHAQRTRAPVEHGYLCPSRAHYRRYRMRVVPLDAGALLLVHHLVAQGPHRHPGRRGGAYLVDGAATTCSHCRRTRRADAPSTWDWVPRHLGRDVPVRHELCPVCARLHEWSRLSSRRSR
jgi:hypothetical protein